MKKAVLDTSFILTCIKNKIDFFEELEFMGCKILIPKQVISELNKIANPVMIKKKLSERELASLSLKILEHEKNRFEVIELGSKYVDKGIIKLARENRDLLIATLDREIKTSVKNPKILIRGKKKLEII